MILIFNYFHQGLELIVGSSFLDYEYNLKDKKVINFYTHKFGNVLFDLSHLSLLTSIENMTHS